MQYYKNLNISISEIYLLIRFIIIIFEIKSMNEAFKIFNNIRILRAQTKEYTLKTLEEMLKKLKLVVNERRKEDNQCQVEIAEHAKKLQQYRDMLIADGINPNELLKSMSSFKSIQKNKRNTRPAKYKYINKYGEIKTWTGQGRTPTVIRQAINKRRKTLNDFLL